ncbi:Zinc finger and SCAN domain-containing protein 21 [Orchesella cincta]|uniref:Zinc finger and SCAN domain-containing protein 21 n=1 Tax=Orchesella cincta TaxID=48709 RepID=A0A1D2MKR9_ORCCI|nr:Zinc finger and SCAN domain-containing protein 21 [Orchesella cincta]
MDNNRDYGESPVSKVQMLCLKLKETQQIVREKDAKLQNIDQVNKELDVEIQTLRKNARDQQNELVKLTSNVSILQRKLDEMTKANLELATKLKVAETQKRETKAVLDKLKEEIDIGVNTFISGDRFNDEAAPIQQDDELTRDTRLPQKQPNEKDDIQNFARAIKVENITENDGLQHSSMSVENDDGATTPVLEKIYNNFQNKLPPSTSIQPLIRSRVSMSARSTTHERDLKKSGFCCSCGSTFSNDRNLKRHIKYFIEKRRFWCKKCEKGFRNRSLLTNHHLKRHNSVILGGADFHCKICRKPFIDRSTFIQHFRKEHIAGIAAHKLRVVDGPTDR